MRNSTNSRVLVAMSGGVDSSVAAYLLKREGHDVIGVTMKLFCYGENITGPKSCCSLDAISDAKSVCEKLGIPHYVLSYEEEFEKKVIDNFVEEYEKGRTPNPCIRCNQLIKFEYLLRKAEDLGCDFLATGHYARVSKQTTDSSRQEDQNKSNYKLQTTNYSTSQLLKGKDTKKDQSYFLYRLRQDQLSKILFPLGELTKSEVRKIAEKAGLKTAQKAESQEICFVSTNLRDYLRNKISILPGDILDDKGNKIGSHQGVIFYTVGQRKGLGGGHEEPMFVTAIDVSKNTITIGKEEDLYVKKAIFEEVIWIGGEPPVKGLRAKIRYNMEEAEIETLGKKENRYIATFRHPIRAVTPGQSIVFYEGEKCLGGGVIE